MVSADKQSVMTLNKQGKVVVATVVRDNTKIDYAAAKPMSLPKPAALVSAIPARLSGQADTLPRNPGFRYGGVGDGQTQPLQLFSPDQQNVVLDALPTAPDVGYEYGTGEWPFTTSRVDVLKVKPTHPQLSKSYPYSAAGKLFFKIGADSYICSASSIAPGLVVTAAHCVAELGQGEQGIHAGFQYIPAYYNGVAPYGKWSADAIVIDSAYLDGSANCLSGVVCDDDVAILRIKPSGKTYPGNKTGWYGFGWDGYGFGSWDDTQITQLGYPRSHDQGKLMQRTDAYGFVSDEDNNNTIIGSRQTGGSSGGPWLVNFGQMAALGDGVEPGSDAESNIVVGVTSWGLVDPTVKLQGASPFTSTNIVPLVDVFCPPENTSKLCQ